MMEVTVVEGVPTLTNAQIACVKMEEQQELKHHVSALFLLLDDLASNDLKTLAIAATLFNIVGFVFSCLLQYFEFDENVQVN